jgi:hypothetical protein
MNREEFVEYLASRAQGLKIPLHRSGKLLGLPREFHQALAIAYLLDALGQPAPSGEALRTWYGKDALASPQAAKWVYRVVGALRDPDLEKLNTKELISFGLCLATWGAAASGVAGDAARKARRVRGLRHRHSS